LERITPTTQSSRLSDGRETSSRRTADEQGGALMTEAQKGQQVAVHVFVNRKKVEVGTEQITGAELLEAGGFEGQGWDLLALQGEGDPTGGELIMFDRVLELKNGDRFRVIPGNRTFGC
jgi:hypothetical protein